MTLLINPARFRLGADTAIGRLLGDEPSGLAIDFTTGQALVRDDSFPVTGFLGDVNSLLTYTAPSPKMVYDVAGLLGYGSHNMFIRSQELDNASVWTVGAATVAANAATAPDGTFTMDKLVENTANTDHYLIANMGSIAGANYTMSIFAKSAGRSWLRVFMGSVGFGVNIFAWVNLSTGAIGTTSGSPSVVVEPFGNGVYRIAISKAAIGTTTTPVSFLLGNADNGSPYLGDGVSGIYLWGAQLEQRSSALTYLPTTTAIRYGIPLDHDPVTHAPLGVLIEEQRTNICLHSQAFDNLTFWTPGGAGPNTITANTAVAPDGTMTADRHNPPLSGADSYVRCTPTQAVSTTYTYSIFAKAGTGTWFHLRNIALVAGGAVAATTCWFNLVTGALGTKGTSVTSYGMQHVGNGWYRCWITGTTPASIGLNMLDFGAVAADGAAIGSPTVGTLYVWGAQMEAGAFPTSYIPTVASQVTRAKDQITLVTSAFPLSATASTVIWGGEHGGYVGSSFPYLLSLDDTTANERFALYISNIVAANATPYFHVNDSGVAQFPGDGLGDGIVTAGTNFRMACAWAVNDFAMSRDGRVAIVDTAGTLPTVNIVRFGMNQTNGLHLNGHIKRLTYLPRRASNAELQRMTA